MLSPKCEYSKEDPLRCLEEVSEALRFLGYPSLLLFQFIVC